MDMKQMVDGAQGQPQGDMGGNAQMMDMMVQMRSMMDQMIQMMGADAKQAGFESVDQG